MDETQEATGSEATQQAAMEATNQASMEATQEGSEGSNRTAGGIFKDNRRLMDYKDPNKREDVWDKFCVDKDKTALPYHKTLPSLKIVQPQLRANQSSIWRVRKGGRN